MPCVALGQRKLLCARPIWERIITSKVTKSVKSSKAAKSAKITAATETAAILLKDGDYIQIRQPRDYSVAQATPIETNLTATKSTKKLFKKSTKKTKKSDKKITKVAKQADSSIVKPTKEARRAARKSTKESKQVAKAAKLATKKSAKAAKKSTKESQRIAKKIAKDAKLLAKKTAKEAKKAQKTQKSTTVTTTKAAKSANGTTARLSKTTKATAEPPKPTKTSKTRKATDKVKSRASFRRRRQSRDDLINAESRLGSLIFGPIPEGHRREFFHDRANIWIWHESWVDAERHAQQITVRYEVRPTGVYKKLSAGRYFRLDGAELENFLKATRIYLSLIKQYIYNAA